MVGPARIYSPSGCRPSGKQIASVRSSSSANPRLFDPQLRGLGGVREKQELRRYQKHQKKKKRDLHRKDLQKKIDYYKPTVAQQPIRNTELEEDMMSMEAKMDRIKKKETNKYKIFSSLRPKLAETEEMTKYLANAARKKYLRTCFVMDTQEH